MLAAYPHFRELQVEPATSAEVSELAQRVFHLEEYLERLTNASYQTGGIEDVASESALLMVYRD
jgi:hypothetical protein